MRRREFITLLSGATAAWPSVARAQQGERMRRVGVLLPVAADDPQYQIWFGAFLQGLAQSGWNIGENVRIDTRRTAGADAVQKNAAELVALAPDVIFAVGASTVGPLVQVTRTVPIVFASVVGIPQADRAKPNADRGASRCRHSHRYRSVWCHSGHGIGAQGGDNSGRLTRR